MVAPRTSDEPAVAHRVGQMNYVLNHLQSLPRPVPERDVLASEQDLLRPRHKNWLTCTRNVTEGRFREERDDPEIHRLVEEGEAIVHCEWYDSTSSRLPVAKIHALSAVYTNTTSRVRSGKPLQNRLGNQNPLAGKVAKVQVNGKAAGKQEGSLDGFVTVYDT